MIRRSLRIGAECVGVLVALTIIAAGVLVWRVAQGPVPLDFVTPRLERELDALHPDIKVAIGGTVLAWEGWPETFALRVRDVRLTGAHGQTARIPAVDLRLHVRALINGTVAPTRITTRGARLTLIRGPDGIRFGSPSGNDADAATAGSRDLAGFLPRIVDDLMAEPTPANPLGYLDALRIADAKVRIRDKTLNTVWRAPEAKIALAKTPRGLTGQADLTVALDPDRVAVNLSLSYVRGADTFTLAGTVGEVRPPILADAADGLAKAANLRVPVSGHGVARLGLDGRLDWATARLRAGRGELAWPSFLPERKAVREARVDVHLNAGTGRLRARDLRIAFGTADAPGPTITGRLDAERAGEAGTIRITTTGRINDLATNALASYWPPGIQDEGTARKWVTTNVTDGRVERADFAADLVVPKGDPGALRLERLDGGMRYTGLSVRYLPGLEPVRDVGGTATFGKKAFRLDVAEGRLRGVAVESAKMTVTGLHLSDQSLDIELTTNGPLRDTLTPLAQPRLALLEDLGLDPARVRGKADVTARFGFPLRKDLTMDEVEVAADAALTDVAITNFLFGHDIARADLDLAIDKAGMSLSGPLTLAGVPLNMQWNERFDAEAMPARRIDAQIPELTAADRARLGKGTAPVLDGPISVNMRWRGDGRGTGTLRAATNLKDAVLELDALKWRKPAGAPGQASFELAIENEKPMLMRQVDVVAGGRETPKLSANGQVRFDPATSRVARASLAEVTLAGTHLTDIDAERTETGWRLAVGGGHVDARPYLADLGLDGSSAGTASDDDEGARPALAIETGRLDYVRLADDRRLRDVRLKLRRDAQGRWPELHLRATVPERFLRRAERDAAASAPKVAVDYGARDDGRRDLSATADNAGATLRALGLLQSVTGGRLSLDGASRRAERGSPIDAELMVKDFKVRDAPVLARLLSVALISGIGDVLRGDGLGFKRLKGDLVLDGGTVSTDLLHAYGPALGITAKGRVDIDANRVDMAGTIVPAALVNRILGAIPLLGKVLTGGEGEGLIGVTYTLTGDMADPEIRVNPLSALAPGFLRGLFGQIADGANEPDRAIPEPGATPGKR